jgi:hypothetical protein
MAVKEKSFWSTTSGVVTGIAGTLTGVVGIVTLAAQMGWIGGDGGDGDDPARGQAGGSTVATAPTVPGNRSGAASSGATSTTPVFSVEPTSVEFEPLGSREATVKVVNDGTAPITVQSPRVEGSNPSQFAVTAPTCTGRDLAPGRSCEVEVTFTPRQSGTYKAELVIQVVGARAQEVELSGQALL